MMYEHFGAGPIAGEESDQIRPDQILPDEGRGLFWSPPPVDRANLVVPAAWAVSGRWWVT